MDRLTQDLDSPLMRELEKAREEYLAEHPPYQGPLLLELLDQARAEEEKPKKQRRLKLIRGGKKKELR